MNFYIIIYISSTLIIILSIILYIITKKNDEYLEDDLKISANKFLKAQNWNPIIDPEHFNNFLKSNKCSLEKALLAFANASQYYASHVPISNYKVGAVVRASSGKIYCGGNTEFIGLSLSCAIHGEQSATHNAFNNGEKELTHLAVNEPPCGYCRQFLNELINADKLIVLIENKLPPKQIISKTLQNGFLPYSFGPKDLGNKNGMFDSNPNNFNYDSSKFDNLANLTIPYFKRSYAPYSLMPSAIGLSFIDGTQFFGIYMENAAYNPSLHPMISAINIALLNNKDISKIDKICLIEAEYIINKNKNISALGLTKQILNSINKSEEDLEDLEYINIRII